MLPLAAIGLYFLLTTGLATALRSREKVHAGSLNLAASSATVSSHKRMFDVVTILDSSSSLLPEEWQQILDTATQVIDNMKNIENSRVSVVSFSTLATVHWYLEDLVAQDADRAKNKVISFPLMGGRRSTGMALSTAADLFYHVKLADPDRFKSRDLSRLVVLVTNGCATGYEAKYESAQGHIKAAVKELRAIPSMTIFVVGIGNNVCKDEIRTIAGCKPASSKEPCPHALFTMFHRLANDFENFLDQAIAHAT